MGDRVSIQFQNGAEKSVVLFSHWGGMEFVETARRYAEALENKTLSKQTSPLDRLEPQTVMVDFVRHITKRIERVERDLYFGFDKDDGDNSDNGHHTIRLVKDEVIHG